MTGIRKATAQFARQRRRRSSIVRRKSLFERLEDRQLLAADVLFADSFESGSNSNDWVGNWVEDSQDDWFRSTQRSTDGARSAEVDGSANNATLTLATPIDLSGYGSAELTFDWFIEKSFDSGEYLSLDVSSDGGASWQADIRRLSGNVDAENTWHSESVDLTPYSSSNLLVRFRSKVSSSKEDANVDNVRITGVPVTPQFPPTIDYLDFISAVGISLIGQSTVAADRLRLSSNGDRWGGAWADEQQVVSTAFETSFDFQLDPTSNGFAFVIQNQRPVMLGKQLGYEGMPDSIAIEFDTRQGGDDPNDNHVSVQTLGPERNSAAHSASIAWGSPAADLNDGQVHTARIVYTPGTLQVFVDEIATPVVEVALELDDVIDLDIGQAWVGFTTQGKQADILSWTFALQVDLSTTVGISDVQIVEGDSGSTQVVATVTRNGSGEFTLDWSTADGTATASADYLADSGTLAFASGDPDEKTITLAVLGDGLEESHETFEINLSLASGSATVVDGKGIVTILNDEAALTITDATAMEGDEAMTFIDVFVPRTIDGLNDARGMDIGPDGNLYVTSEKGPWPGAVLRYDGQSGQFIDLFAVDAALDGAKDVEFGPDGHLYVTNNGTNTVVRFDGSTGAFLDVFVTAKSGGLEVPRGLTFGPDSTGDEVPELYVVSAFTDEILRYNGATGEFIDVFGAAGSGGMNEPTALSFGPDGNLYVAVGAHVQTNNTILRFDGGTGNFMDEFVPAGTAGLQLAPTGGLLFGPDLNGDAIADLLVSNGGPNNVLAFDGATGGFLEVYVADGSGGLSDPKGMAIDAYGNLLVISNGTDEVLRFGAKSTAAFRVELSSPIGIPVSVDFSTSDGTASADNDYTAANGRLNIGVGATSQTILISSIDDTDFELDETFHVTLSNAIGASVTDGVGAATIIDDDLAPHNEPPAADAGGPYTATEGLAVALDASASSDSDGTIVNYEWDFDGDGFDDGSGVMASYTNSAPGDYTVWLRVTDDDGASNTTTATITVNPVTTGPNLSHGEVASVRDTWQTVTLPTSYASMVVIATPRYNPGSGPGVARIRDAAGGSFQVRVDNVGTSDFSGGVHYVVVEEGVYDEAGFKMEAVKVTSTSTSRKNAWGINNTGYQQSYASPVVVGQVMSASDDNWSVFWASSDSRTSPPSAYQLNIGKHVGEDPDSTRANETIGYLVIEATQNGVIEGLPFVAGVGSDIVKGVGDGSYTYNYTAMPNSKTAVLSQAGMDGGDGGWAVLNGTNPLSPSGGTIDLVIDEDQLADSERKHTTEQVAYFVIDPPVKTASDPSIDASLLQHAPTTIRDLMRASHTVRSEPSIGELDELRRRPTGAAAIKVIGQVTMRGRSLSRREVPISSHHEIASIDEFFAISDAGEILVDDLLNRLIP